MEEKIYGTILTALGLELITQAVTEGKKVSIAYLAVGDGGGAYYLPTGDMGALKNEVWRGAVKSIKVNGESPNMIDVEAVIPANVGGWTIREMCLFTDAGEMLAICNTPDTEKVIITAGAAGEILVVMHIKVENTSAMSFAIDTSVVTATVKDLEDHNESESAHENLQLLIKQAIAANMTLSYDPDAESLSLRYVGGSIAPGTGEAYVLPVATASTLGGVKIGGGVDVETDGTISVNATEVIEDAAATEDDAAEVLAEIFGDAGT